MAASWGHFIYICAAWLMYKTPDEQGVLFEPSGRNYASTWETRPSPFPPTFQTTGSVSKLPLLPALVGGSSGGGFGESACAFTGCKSFGSSLHRRWCSTTLAPTLVCYSTTKARWLRHCAFQSSVPPCSFFSPSQGSSSHTV